MHIHNAIYNTIHEDGFSIERKSGIADFLLLYIKTPSLLSVSENTYTITEPSVIIISGYTPFKYLSVTTPYCDDYIHFLPQNLDEFLSKLHFPLNKPIKINNHDLIDPIIQGICQEYYHATEFVLDVQYHQMMHLMARIGESWSAAHHLNTNVPYFQDLSNIRRRILADPTRNWKIKDLAKEITLSPAYFQVLYKKAFGTTCLSDIIENKISTAKEYLLSTDMSVADISLELGYSQVYHFIRQFKKSTGVTPGAFRKSMR
nr:helix-turn-helix transcriptional regulator [Eubacterium sp.]